MLLVSIAQKPAYFQMEKKGLEAMKTLVIMQIEDGNEENVTAAAFSQDTANIYITAASMDAAQALLPTGTEKATEAMLVWTPQEKPVKEELHYPVCPRCVEEMAEDAEEYENSPAGQRFLRTLNSAREFEKKHYSRNKLGSNQLIYLANKHQNSLINGSFDIWALAYRKGYKDGILSK